MIAGRKWVNIIDELQNYRVSSFLFKVIKWIPLKTGWLKQNTDDTSKDNMGPSSISFCIRNQKIVI